jgi:hypothetical protein
MTKSLELGLYESLIDEALAEAIRDVNSRGLKCVEEALDRGDSHEFFARYVFEAVLRALRGLPSEEKVVHQLALSNQLLSILRSAGDRSEGSVVISQPARILRSVTRPKEGLAATEFAVRPDIPLSQSDLLVNARRGTPDWPCAGDRDCFCQSH